MSQQTTRNTTKQRSGSWPWDFWAVCGGNPVCLESKSTQFSGESGGQPGAGIGPRDQRRCGPDARFGGVLLSRCFRVPIGLEFKFGQIRRYIGWRWRAASASGLPPAAGASPRPRCSLRSDFVYNKGLKRGGGWAWSGGVGREKTI